VDAPSAGLAPRSKLVVGLGNPGERYTATRHNVGFRVVEELARRRGLALSALECSALVAAGDGFLLAQPQTYMNRSGYAVHCLVERRGFEPGDILAVYDEVQLPLGRLRLRPSGSPGGHRGMESIADSLATDQVPRLRLGIGIEPPPPGDALPDFVLAPFAAEEREAVADMISRAADACELWLAEGAEAAMRRFNG
jgi:PTH1 family peptidyl-tRNA hydrolase